MAPRGAQLQILRLLAAFRGRAPQDAGAVGLSEDDIIEAIEGLHRMRYVRVVGPPSGNSLIDQDVEGLHRRPFGVGCLKALPH
jgi:hypothetical protein